MLEDHADASAQRYQPVLVELTDVHMIDQHPASARLLQTIDGTDQRRLAGAAAADDAEHFAALDRQVDTVQGIDRSLLALVDLAQADKAHVGAIQFGMQLGLFCVLRWRVVQPALGGRCTHA